VNVSKTIAALSTLDAYERWAPSYLPAPHNPVMRAEQGAMLELLPPIAGKSALDLACGTGRYARLLAEAGAARVVAADFSPAMLRRVDSAWRVRAGLTALPFANGAFDIVVSGLALGHAADLRRCFDEIARVLVPGGVLLYSDFHHAATLAGQTRSFRDERGRRLTVPPDGYAIDAHRTAALGAGFAIDELRELRVGIELNEVFEGSDALYSRFPGLPIALVMRARR